ncbi:hypothetical protein AB1Y20_022111 [Prymnesium parvum]|uniref:Uncharacterized protein n=1 Tax=Prymnesium parvum TaxID=97485 RepID=A0AB34JFX4_PRYPA
MAAPVASPLLRRFTNVCVHIAYKGTMNRQGYAWYANPADGQRPPDPPLFSRHVEFLEGEASLQHVVPWWKEGTINQTVGYFGSRVKVTASDLKQAANKRPAVWIPNASWFLDFSHGGTPNLWRNICHFSNSMFPFFEAAHKAQVCALPLRNVLMWQVGFSASLLGNSSYHGGLLGAILHEHRRVWSEAHGVPPAREKLRLWFDEDLRAGDTLCFEEVVIVRETNPQHRKLALQTRASMSTAGVARGFGGDPRVRAAFRAAVLSHLRVRPPQPRVPTITYLSRPLGRNDALLHGRAWQLRCHVTLGTFRRLKAAVYEASGYSLVRAVFERTTYAYQAEVISQTDLFWAGHGAGLVHIPLLPKLAVVIEMFNCGHFSYLYANLALHLGVKYFAMQRREPYCTTPSSLYGDTRKNMSKTYAYTFDEAYPTLMQAIRYHLWQDPSQEIHGREPKCAYAQKMVAVNGMLPVGMSRLKWQRDCVPGFGESDRARRHRMKTNAFKQKDDPPRGTGKPGQFTRWAGLG